MDLGRFHYALDTFIKDIESTNATENLQNIINLLHEVASNSAPSTFDAYKQQIEATRNALQSSILNNPSLEVASFLEEFSLKSYAGSGLFSSIIKTISENQLSPHAAIQAMQKLQDKFLKKISNLKTINNAFTEIGAPYDSEQDGDSEIEIKIPAEYETKTLEDLSKEAKEWDRDVKTITEVFDPERPESRIRTLSTGSWEFYLASTPLVIFGFAKCLKGINSILSELIKTRQLLSQLKSSSAPQEVTEKYEEHLNDSIGKNLSALAAQLVDEYYKGSDDGRRAELKNALTQSLKRLSKKLSEGSKVSLRLTKPAAPKVNEENNPTPEEINQIKSSGAIERIREETIKVLSTLNDLDHDPDIVKNLPSPDGDE